MTEKQWTQGRWVVDHEYNVIVDGSGGGVGYPPTDGTIASLCDGEYICNENPHDAHLIAAAPDLVEALEFAAKVLERTSHDTLDGRNASRQARAALAKAYGDEQ